MRIFSIAISARLKAAGLILSKCLAPLKSPINLFPYTIDSLRDAVIDKVSRKDARQAVVARGAGL